VYENKYIEDAGGSHVSAMTILSLPPLPFSSSLLYLSLVTISDSPASAFTCLSLALSFSPKGFYLSVLPHSITLISFLSKSLPLSLFLHYFDFISD
jgi:hypothetical protein